MVVTLRVENSNVHRILIDEGSSIDVLSRSSFDKMSFTSDMLRIVLFMASLEIRLCLTGA